MFLSLRYDEGRRTNLAETGRGKRESERQTIEAIDQLNAEGGWLKVASFVDFNTGAPARGKAQEEKAPETSTSDMSVMRRLLIELKVRHG